MNSQSNRGDPLVLAKGGPIGILPQGGYYRCVVESGTSRFWLVSLYTKELRLETVAGQIYYVRVGLPDTFMNVWDRDNGQFHPPGIEFALISPDSAKTEIVLCQQLDE
jgi:hypothetical protein